MWNLLALAVRVKLGAFTKVKAAVDKMLAGLKTHLLQTDMTLEAQERKTGHDHPHDSGKEEPQGGTSWLLQCTLHARTGPPRKITHQEHCLDY